MNANGTGVKKIYGAPRIWQWTEPVVMLKDSRVPISRHHVIPQGTLVDFWNILAALASGNADAKAAWDCLATYMELIHPENREVGSVTSNSEKIENMKNNALDDAERNELGEMIVWQRYNLIEGPAEAVRCDPTKDFFDEFAVGMTGEI